MAGILSSRKLMDMIDRKTKSGSKNFLIRFYKITFARLTNRDHDIPARIAAAIVAHFHRDISRSGGAPRRKSNRLAAAGDRAARCRIRITQCIIITRN